MSQLGGSAVYLAAQEIGFGKRESVPDIARNLSRWVDIIAARVFAHATEQLRPARDGAHHQRAVGPRASVPGHGGLLHAVGARAASGQDPARLESETAITSPLRLAPRGAARDADGRRDAARLRAGTGHPGRVPRDRRQGRPTTEARDAAEGADVIYTDAWVSMGQEAERERRQEAFQRYQVNEALLRFAARGAGHALSARPPRRGDHRPGAGWAAERDPGPGREPAARAEGHHPPPPGWRAAVGRTVKKVVLAYSGGLDTSVILRWLLETYDCEVVAYCADLGQGEELIPARGEGPAHRRLQRAHRRSPRRVRPRLRVPDAPRQRGVRGHLPDGDVDRAAAHRQGPGGGRAEGRARTR